MVQPLWNCSVSTFVTSSCIGLLVAHFCLSRSLLLHHSHALRFLCLPFRILDYIVPFFWWDDHMLPTPVIAYSALDYLLMSMAHAHRRNPCTLVQYNLRTHAYQDLRVSYNSAHPRTSPMAYSAFYDINTLSCPYAQSHSHTDGHAHSVHSHGYSSTKFDLPFDPRPPDSTRTCSNIHCNMLWLDSAWFHRTSTVRSDQYSPHTRIWVLVKIYHMQPLAAIPLRSNHL